MAFAKQFFSSYKSNNNLDYYLEIWVDGFDSSATEISIGAGGPVISYETDQEDRFSPILSSQCVLPFVVKNTSLQAFIQLLRTTYQERQVYLHLYRATSSTYTTTKPIWSGFLVMDLGSGEDVSFPYEQKLTFVDGLSLLKDIDFVDLSNAGSETNIQGSYTQDNMYYGPAVYTFWIKEILAKAGVAISGVDGQGVSIDYGFTTAVNWYNADMQNTNQGSDPLGLTQCVVSMFHNKNDQDVFTPENCYTVLKQLLRHWGARITYWKHEFWIVQIPEYIQDESGLIDNPDNINSRQYNRFGTLTGSQDHLGDTYYTRYEQTIQSNQVSKLVGTKYNYLPMIHNAEADFLSFASKNYYGGFPYGVSAESQEIFQGTIIDPSTANFLWLSIPLNWTWDMTGSSLTDGHIKGWWCSVRFNFYASDGTTTYYLQYDSSNQGSYYWVLEADWAPLGNASPKYIIKSNSLTETNYIGFQESIPFVDSSGSAITMTGAWSFFLDIEDFANQSSNGNNGSFYCRFSGYQPSSHYSYVKKDPYQEFPYLPTSGDVSGGGPQTKSGTVRWSNTLENPSGITTTSFSTPAGFDAGTSQADIQLITTSAFKGLLQTLNTTQTSSFGLSLNTQVNNSTNTEKFSFGTLLWGDAIQQFAVGCLRVNNGTAFVKTNPDGEWGRGTLTGTNTFTELLIDEFLSGQIKVVIAPTMRLAVGEENKNQTATGTGGPATRPRYVNPIGRLREFRSNETDPEYIFRRGSFHSLYDEWDYEGYQILRDTVSSTTTTTDIGDLGGTQDNKPISNAKIIPNVTDALMINSPVASIRTTVPATGSNVAVNGNFNTAVGWTLGTGWSIDTTAKKAKFAATGSTSELTQSVLTQGLTYQVNFQVVVTAGTLLVKAGTSGTSQSITTSGDYSLYLDCDGSNLIKFQAGTTFTGNITYITLRDQKSISAVPINSIGSTVFKSGDTFNLINSLGGEILPLTVSSNQGASDDTISVTSTALFDDIGIDSVLLINQDDLSAQYQNKTKGTVGGFDITATSIDSGSVSIGSYIDDDTFATASATSLATSESIKAYVDGQAGHSETLQGVTDNGNTTTNSITIGSSDTPTKKLNINQTADSEGIRITGYDNENNSHLDLYVDNFGNDYITSSEFLGIHSGGSARIRSVNYLRLEAGGNANNQLQVDVNYMKFSSGGSERMRLTTTGLGIGTTSPIEPLHVFNSGYPQLNLESNAGSWQLGVSTGNDFAIRKGSSGSSYPLWIDSSENVGIGTFSPSEKLHVVGKGIFTDQVTIPATPVASTDAASKSYVDAQVGASDTLQEVTDNGNTTTNSIMIGSSSAPSEKLEVVGKAIIRKSGSATAHGDTDLFVTDATAASSTAAIQILGGNTGFSNLQFSDTDSYSQGAIIYGHTDNYMAFKANASEKMRLTSGGNLGIGFTNPDKLIDIASSGENTNAPTFRITNTANNSASNWNGKISHAIEFYSTDASRVGLASSIQNIAGTDKGGVLTGNITFNTADWPTGGIHERMRITDSGNVGIGTTSPSEKLHVVGDILATGDSHADAFKPAVSGNPIKFKNFDSTTEFARITDGGNVLIGTTTDSGSKLTVEGNSFINSGSLKITNSSVTNYYQSTKMNSYGSNYDWQFSGTNVMRITSGGNVLIGTTTDDGSNKLQVNGGCYFNGNVLIENNKELRWKDSGGSQRTILELTNANDLYFGGSFAGSLIFIGGGSYTERARINDSGNFCINTSTGVEKLSVNGNIAVTNGSGVLIGGAIGDTKIGKLYNVSGVLSLDGDGTRSIRFGSTTNGEVMRINNTTSNVLIGTTTDSGVYKLDVFGKARVQSVFELDDVLTLNQISTPSDPASGKSSIYMDSADGAIKVKINVGGTVVTRTIASFE